MIQTKSDILVIWNDKMSHGHLSSMMPKNQQLWVVGRFA